MLENLRLRQALRRVDNRNFGTRKKAFQIIADEQYEPAIPKLRAILFDDSIEERTRALAARALGKIGTEDALRALIAILSEISPDASNHAQHRKDSLETVQLQGAMLGTAVIVALRSVGTPEANRVITCWNQGKHAAK